MGHDKHVWKNQIGYCLTLVHVQMNRISHCAAVCPSGIQKFGEGIEVREREAENLNYPVCMVRLASLTRGEPEPWDTLFSSAFP